MELKNHISVSGLSFGYGERSVLEDINFMIDEGEIVTLLGPNAAAKRRCFALYWDS
jgi:ABC-type lipopolysaccharide export system ATPase subunit